MFDRNKPKQPATPARAPDTPPPATTPTDSPRPAATRSTAIIGPSIVIKGEVSGEEDLVVQGRVEGTIDLRSNEVAVGQSGQVRADIKAKVIKIEGEVTGDITGIENVVITRSGNVRGNIVSPRVTLEDGAIFKGSIDMDPGESESTSVPITAQKKPAAPAATEKAPELDLKSG